MGPDASIQFGTLNAGKQGVTLDLNTEAGREVLCDLVEWADVFVESYTPGTLDDWGIGYDVLAERNPGLILLSTSLMGQSGPLSTFAGFGNLAGAITGYYEMTGWPDRPPAGALPGLHRLRHAAVHGAAAHGSARCTRCRPRRPRPAPGLRSGRGRHSFPGKPRCSRRP